MENYIAYIDESGGHGFDFSKSGNSTHFVICAIITNSEKNNELFENFNKIKNKYFPISELKSSKIGNNDNIRIKILNDVNLLDFKYYCLIVDKKQILPETGLRYKEVFYKFLYGILYNNLYRTFRNLSIVADEMITNEFIVGFTKYVKENHIVDLFNQNLIEFKKSNNTVLLQLSDLIGGTINRFVSRKTEIEVSKILENKSIGEITWPENYKPFTVDETEIDDEFKEIISDLALLRIDSYLNKHSKSVDPIIKLRIYFLNYLKSIFNYNSKTRFIFTDEIIKHLEKQTGEVLKVQLFRQQIVGPLRSEGILISSSGGGYKIPSSQSDIYSFFNLSSRIIFPMVDRLKQTYQALLQATDGKLDILGNTEYEFLKKIIG